MFKGFNFRDFIFQVKNSIGIIKETIPFAKKHKLWQGFFQHKWIFIFTLIIGGLFTFFVISDLLSMLTPSSLSETSPEILEAGLEIDTDKVKETISGEGRKAVFSGGSKYLLLIILEVITFHFSVKTLSLLKNTKEVPELKDFVNAEKRMINIMLRNFVKGLIVHGILVAVLSIIGFKFLVPAIMFFVYSYFVGYAFLDNYNEQFNQTIKKSQMIIRNNVGATVAIGLAANLLLFVPLIGPVIVPILGSIAAALYGDRHQIEGVSEWMFDDEPQVVTA